MKKNKNDIKLKIKFASLSMQDNGKLIKDAAED